MGLERQDDFLSPPIAKEQIRRVTEGNLGARINADQNSASPSSNTSRKSLPNIPISARSAPAKTVGKKELLNQPKPPCLAEFKKKSTTNEELPNETSTETIVSTDDSGYVRPDYFTGFPTGRQNRRSWRPKATTEGAGLSTPTLGVKEKVAITAPNTAPTTSGKFGSIDSARINADQNSASPSSNTSTKSLPNIPISAPSAPAKTVGKQELLLYQPKPPFLVEFKEESSNEELPNEESTETIAYTDDSGYVRPDYFTGSPSGGQNIRSWRPMATTEGAGLSTPTRGVKEKVAITAPNTAPTTSGKFGSIDSALQYLKPPLSTSSHHKKSSNDSCSSAGHSGYGRPCDFVGSPAGGQMIKSSRPKESSTGTAPLNDSMLEESGMQALLPTKSSLPGRASDVSLKKTSFNPDDSYASCGETGFGRSGNFVGSPKGATRRSWKPKEIATETTFYKTVSTPKEDGVKSHHFSPHSLRHSSTHSSTHSSPHSSKYSSEHSLTLTLAGAFSPNSSYSSFGESGFVLEGDGMNALLPTKSPLSGRPSGVSPKKTSFNPNDSYASCGETGFGRPGDFIGSPKGATRRSWKPKETATETTSDKTISTPEENGVKSHHFSPHSSRHSSRHSSTHSSKHSPRRSSKHSSQHSLKPTLAGAFSPNSSCPSFGEYGLGRPDDFVGSPSGSARKSWKPKETVLETTPELNVVEIGSTHDGDGVNSRRSSEHSLKPSSTIADTFNLNNSVSSFGEADFERPDDSVRSPAGSGARRSWKPKEIETTPKRHVESIYATPEADGKEKVSIQSNSESLPLTAPLTATGETVPQTSEESKSPTRNTIDSEGMNKPLPLDHGSRRESAPAFLEDVRANMSPLSQSAKRRWSRKVDPSRLPPAFRTTHRASTGSVPSPRTNVAFIRRHIDPNLLEKVVSSRQKTILSPSKLKRKWPPVRTKTDTTQISRARASRVLLNEAVKSRRNLFEEHAPEDKAGMAVQIIKRRRESHEHSGNVSPGSIISEISEVFDDVCSVAVATAMDDHASRKDHGEGHSPPRLKIQCQVSMKIRWRGPISYNIKGRPLYYDDSFIDDEGNELPFAPLLEDRFGSSNVDSALMEPPRRRYDGLSDDESYYSGDEEGDGGNAEGIKPDGTSSHGARGHKGPPDVWVTPMDGETGPTGEAKWRVKRVWDIAAIDAHEKEHEVDDSDMMDKVKTLLGVPTGASIKGCGVTIEASTEGCGVPTEESIQGIWGYHPSMSHWEIKKVYDIEGEIWESGKAQNMDESEMRNDFVEVAKKHSEHILPAMGEADESEAVKALEQKPSELNITDHTDELTMDGSAHMYGDSNAAENSKTDDSVADASGIIGERADHEKYENQKSNGMH
jgi:hypothetical protein